MFQLLALPSEVQLQIWESIVTPKDMKSLALVSKRINSCSEPARLTLRYGHCKVGHARPADLLQKVLQNPYIASYIESFSILDWKGSWDTRGKSHPHYPYSEECMSLFTRTLHASKLVPSDEVEGWVAAMTVGDEEPLLVLLIEQLPRLKTLFFRNKSDDRGARFFAAIQKLSYTSSPGVLSRLSKVYLGDELSSNDCKIRWLHIFSTIPSVREIEGHNVGSRFYEDSHYDEPLPPTPSNVKTLKLQESRVQPPWLCKFLETFKILESFSYVDCHVRYPGSWGPEHVFQGLLDGPASSLKVLHVYGKDFDECIGFSLAGLQVLEELKIERRLLIDSSPSTDASQLTAMLPPSLRTLHFVRSAEYRLTELNPIIEYVADAALIGLPELKTIVFGVDEYLRGRFKGDEKLWELLNCKCGSLGMQLVVDESSSHTWP